MNNFVRTLIVITGVFFLVVVRTWSPFPATSDQAYFLPPSFVFAETGKLANPWLGENFSVSLNWHGFLQPYVVGLIARAFGGGWTAVYLAVNLLAGGTFFFVAVVLHRLKIGALETSCILLMTFALLLDFRARPELLATFETVVLFLVCAERPDTLLKRPARSILLGLILAALLATHPVIFGLSVLGLAIYIVQSPTYVLSRAVILDLLRFASVTVAVFLCALLLLSHFCFGGPIFDWVKGIRFQAGANAARSDFEGIAKYYLANRFLPGLGLGIILLLALAHQAWLSIRPLSAGRLARGALLAFLLILAAVSLFRLALRIPATYYNFSGSLVLVSLTSAVAIKASTKLACLKMATLITLGIAGLFGGGLWFIQALIDHSKIQPTARMLAADIDATRAQGLRTCSDAAALPALDNVNIALSLRLCFDPQTGDRNELCSSNSGLVREPSSSECDVYFALQNQQNQTNPGAIPGFRLTVDRFSVGPLERFRLRPLHYGYARYEAR